jgi:8-oxo-dGTP pyrophosphatase MutT (NUDIX family)
MQKYQFLSSWKPLQTIDLDPKVQVVTVFLQKEERFLVLQRARKDAQYRLWGIPGGKLEQEEDPVKGLLRELYEETGLELSSQSFQLLGTALSHTPTDGQYGLYIYHSHLLNEQEISINTSEHYAFKWVTLDEFKELSLLTAQFEAFKFVEYKLTQILNHQENRFPL